MMRFIPRSLLAFATSALLLGACSDDSPETTSGGGAALNEPCAADADCAPGFNVVCMDTGDGQCSPIVKRCISFPATCSENPMRTVCGCDGKTHAVGGCPSTMAADVDLRPGACPPAAGTFWCGSAACNAGTQYCVEGYDAVNCLDLPAACAAPNANCACLMAQGMSACGCADEAGGGIRVNGCGI